MLYNCGLRGLFTANLIRRIDGESWAQTSTTLETRHDRPPIPQSWGHGSKELIGGRSLQRQFEVRVVFDPLGAHHADFTAECEELRDDTINVQH